MPAKTATGTIAIQVEDLNDHCPTLTSNVQTLCIPNDAIIVNARDDDAYPNGPPFNFAIVPEGTQGKWQVEHLNGEEHNASVSCTYRICCYRAVCVLGNMKGMLN